MRGGITGSCAGFNVSTGITQQGDFYLKIKILLTNSRMRPSISMSFNPFSARNCRFVMGSSCTTLGDIRKARARSNSAFRSSIGVVAAAAADSGAEGVESLDELAWLLVPACSLSSAMAKASRRASRSRSRS